MKTKFRSVISGLLGVFCTFPMILGYGQAVQAQNRDIYREHNREIMLHNHKHRSSVVGLYVWNFDRQDWSRNRLDWPLSPGEDSRIMLSRRHDECNYTIKIVDSNDRESVGKINTCQYRHLVINHQGMSPESTNPDNSYR